jgi:hypothetical protein
MAQTLRLLQQSISASTSIREKASERVYMLREGSGESSSSPLSFRPEMSDNISYVK